MRLGNDAFSFRHHHWPVMRVLSQRDCDVLVNANHQLEQMYSAQKAPCLALHIARNYYLLCSKMKILIVKRGGWAKLKCGGSYTGRDERAK